MLESLTSLAYGFNIALQPQNLFYCFIGVTMGTLVGVLPGIGPTATIALLLPATFKLNPISAIIMLSGICYGAMYGGSTTSILLNIPGEASSVVTCLDGYQMARQGPGRRRPWDLRLRLLHRRHLQHLRPHPARADARRFRSQIRAAGILRSHGHGVDCGRLSGEKIDGQGFDDGGRRHRAGMHRPGSDHGNAAVYFRHTGSRGRNRHSAGGHGAIRHRRSSGEPRRADARPKIFAGKIKGLFPDREDWRRSIGPIARGSLLGFFLGLLPGVGAIVPQFLSYALEKKLSRHPERFGSGEIEGVASPEACNNAAVGGTFIPLLSLGIPSTAMTAILAGGADDLRPDSRALVDQEFAGSFLGRDREHVHRQSSCS